MEGRRGVAKYTVTDTREVSTLTPVGTERKYYRVWITTENGAMGSVDVPLPDWDAEKLPGILEEKARLLDLAFSVGA